MIGLGGVVADAGFRRGLEREGEGHREIRRAGAVVNHPERQRAGPAPQVAIDRVILFLQTAVRGVEIVPRAETPVVIQPVKKRAGDEIVGLRKPVKSAAQIPVAKAPAPAFIRREGELIKRQIQMAAVDGVTQLRIPRDPRARLEREVGVLLFDLA